ncbi:uncharacterized protein PHACADRAFT_104198 [Phanerochaete carnosa HHB-10118-sp]|uniref:Uncharacterized protein n=1 Tax=Phanerochaete carnosa (strain HHB-10118-sp) TaxID=650164 RepID=K5VVU9_PHACS|nr:uncharacterized protein PHACADRAFT_104198 [Phanerochaete carnosa HHB-10118-sp]EKM50709.1 hypothetical protein PHACADRAFT_104198 [Phanerochaete carnosa HHB-10118-sp]
MEPSAKPRSSQAIERVHGLYQLARLHKFPLGSLIIYWPYGWGVAMAASKEHAPMHTILKSAAILLVVATLYHSAFCVWNDICDRDLDGKVERTRGRPLVTGLVPLTDAFALFAALLMLSFFTFLVQCTIGSYHDRFGVMLTSLPINLVYPLTKRWTWWPQLWLGIACGWGCAVGWASLAGDRFELQQLPALQALCVADVLFTIFADTIYAAQDKSDDEKAGIKSTARLFGSHIRGILALFAIAFVGSLVLAGLLNGNNLPYFMIGCAGVAAHIIWQFYVWQPDDDECSAAIFKSNHDMGYILFIGIILDSQL